MPPLADRERFEAKIVSDLTPVFAREYDRAIAAPDRIPFSGFRRELAAVLRTDLARVFRAAGQAMILPMGLVFTSGAFSLTADQWATAQAQDLARGVVDTSRDMAAQAVEKSDGDRQRLAEALAVVFLSDRRLENIAVTEVTRATSAGEHAVVIPYNQSLLGRREPGERRRSESQLSEEEERRHLDEERDEQTREAEEEATGKKRKPPARSIKIGHNEEGKHLIPIWRIDPNSNVCEHCLPLNGHSREVWAMTYPMGPPGHVNCRCALQWQEAAEFARSAA